MAKGSAMDSERSTLEPVLDIRGALARLDGDEDLLVDLMGFFLEDSSRLLAQLSAAVAAADATEIRMTAHALKGLVAGCGGVRAAAAAKRLEIAAESRNLRDIPALAAALTTEIETVRCEAQGYLA
jgi:HPt (histidine-containing phosphotransfer) domain-containing protein